MNGKAVSGIIVLIGLVGSGVWAWDKWTLWHATVGSTETWCIEISPDDLSPDSPSYWGIALPEAQRVITWRGWSVRPGRYCESSKVPAHRIARRIATGEREEIPVIVPAKRHIGDIAAAIASRMWADSAALVEALDQDSMRWRIVPNTYRMYWEVSADDVAARLLRESEKWWNRERLQTAWSMGLTAREVVTLASIVQEETARLDEAPRVAGLYLNRLKKRHAIASRSYAQVCLRRLGNSTAIGQRQAGGFTLQHLPQSGLTARSYSHSRTNLHRCRPSC